MVVHVNGGTERVVCFGPAGRLVGILGDATGVAKDPVAVLLLNAGMLHRVGPNRLHVKLARRLSELGYPNLRFDFGGIGDSSPGPEDLAEVLAQLQAECGLAMDYLQSSLGIERFVLVGMCSGADIALCVANHDSRVVGSGLINGRFFDSIEDTTLWAEAEERTRARHYRSRLCDWKSWRRVVTGQTNYRALLRHLGFRVWRRRAISPSASVSSPNSFKSKLLALKSPILLVYSDGSSSWELARMRLGESLPCPHRRGLIQIECLAQTDHVFTSLAHQAQLIAMVAEWLDSTAELRPDSPLDGSDDKE